MQWSARSLAALGCHASDLRSTDASASNVSSGHLDGTLPEVLIELPPRPCHPPSSSSAHRRCVHGRKGSHDVSARLLTEAGRGVSQSVGNHLRMHRTDIDPYSQPTEEPPASTQPPCGGTR